MIATTTIQHYGNEIEVKPAVGLQIKVDGAKTHFRLTDGIEYVDSGFPGCDFYAVREFVEYPYSIACNVTVTGRTIQRPDGVHGRRAVRVELEWVGDCEPSTFSKGWLYLE